MNETEIPREREKSSHGLWREVQCQETQTTFQFRGVWTRESFPDRVTHRIWWDLLIFYSMADQWPSQETYLDDLAKETSRRHRLISKLQGNLKFPKDRYKWRRSKTSEYEYNFLIHWPNNQYIAWSHEINGTGMYLSHLTTTNGTNRKGQGICSLSAPIFR